jgi:hypothetical protein
MNRSRTVSALMAAALLAAVLSTTSPAKAVGVYGALTNAKIRGIDIASSSGHAIITFNAADVVQSGSPSTPSACRTSTLIVDLSTNKGRAILNLAMAAYLSGRYVVAIGTGVCSTVVTTAENVSQFGLKLDQ